MKTLILIIVLQTGVNYEAVLPEETRLRITEIKNSRGKGKGNTSWFAKYM